MSMIVDNLSDLNLNNVLRTQRLLEVADRLGRGLSSYPEGSFATPKDLTNNISE